MRTQIPFTIHIKIVPSRGIGKKFDYIRAMQKTATDIYEQVATNSQIQLPIPGSGQRLSDSGKHGGFSTLSNGMAAKPQIGQNPAQIMCTGFFNPTTDTKNIPTNPPRPLIHAGQYIVGEAGSSPWNDNQNAMIDNYCRDIKSIFESAATSIDQQASIYKLEVAGITYGYKSRHFPV